MDGHIRQKASFGLMNVVRQSKFGVTILAFLLLYIIANDVFAIGYWVERHLLSHTVEFQVAANVKQNKYSLLDCFYFSFITASTIGYGDITPVSEIEKCIVMFQSVFCTVYVAVMMSIITSKMLWPTRNTIVFSDKIIHDRKGEMFGVRIINTNALPILNPDVRVTVTEHGSGNKISRRMDLDNTLASPQYLGKHDSTLWFGIGNVKYYNNVQESAYHKILKEYNCAKQYEGLEDNTAESDYTPEHQSWFRITISISGSNGVQNIAEIKKYYAKDFVDGVGFRPIQYSGKEREGISVNYKKIQDFWVQFNAYEVENISMEATCVDHYANV